MTETQKPKTEREIELGDPYGTSKPIVVEDRQQTSDENPTAINHPLYTDKTEN